jgi:hypothetical protein
MRTERLFRTESGGGTTGARPCIAVDDLACRLKKITASGEGKVAIAVELEAHDDHTPEQIRDLIRARRGEMWLSIAGVRGDLPF